jgi:hypothetical protein
MIRIVNFTCPQTGARSSAVVPDGSEAGAGPYREVLCPACGWFHAVNIETGEVPRDQDQDQ